MATPGGAFPRGEMSTHSGCDIPRTRTATGARQHVPIYMLPDIKDDEDDDDDDEMEMGSGFGGVGSAPPIKKKMEKAKWSANEVCPNRYLLKSEMIAPRCISPPYNITSPFSSQTSPLPLGWYTETRSRATRRKELETNSFSFGRQNRSAMPA